MDVKRFPPLNWLRAFEASARHMNFTKAAKELNMTQAAVSQQIGKLESYLGAALFERKPQGLKITDQALAYLPSVQECILRLSKSTEELFGTSAKNRLIVDASLVYLTECLAPIIGDFNAAHPNVTLQFVSNLYDIDIKKSADIAILVGSGRWPGYKCDRLTWDNMFPVCSPSVAEKYKSDSLQEFLLKVPLLHVMGYEDGWGYWLNQLNVEGVDHSKCMQTDTLLSAFRLAEMGLGVALARSSLVEKKLEEGVLVQPFPDSVPSNDAFYLAVPQHREGKEIRDKFRHWLLSNIDSKAEW